MFHCVFLRSSASLECQPGFFLFSLLSVFHAAPPGGQWLEFVKKTNLSQEKNARHSRRAVRLQMKKRSPEFYFLGMLSGNFSVGMKGEGEQEIFMPNGEIGVTFKVEDYSQSKSN